MTGASAAGICGSLHIGDVRLAVNIELRYLGTESLLRSAPAVPEKSITIRLG